MSKHCYDAELHTKPLLVCNAKQKKTSKGPKLVARKKWLKNRAIQNTE